MSYYVNLSMYKQSCIDTDLTFCQGDYGQKLIITGISDSRDARIVFRKPNGDTAEYTGLIKNADDNYEYTLQPRELQAVGKVVADVKFSDANSRESSQKFTFAVKPDTITESVKHSEAYSDSIEQAKTEFEALIADMTTDVENNTAQKIADANTQLQTFITNTLARIIAAAEACEGIAENLTGINDQFAGLTTTYSGVKIEALKDEVDADITDLGGLVGANASNIASLKETMAAPFSPDGTYSVGDIRTYENKLYKCNTDISTAEEWTSSHWTEITCEEAIYDVKQSVVALNNNLKVTTLSATDTLASVVGRISEGQTKEFLYNGNALPSDYPSALTESGNTFFPLVRATRVIGIFTYLHISAPNKSTGKPKNIDGYYNGSIFLWGDIY